MSNDKHNQQHGRGIDTAQKVAALILATLTLCGVIFSAGSLFQRISNAEQRIAFNTSRLNELELWRRDAYGASVNNDAQHKRIEELIKGLKDDLEKLELLMRNKP